MSATQIVSMARVDHSPASPERRRLAATLRSLRDDSGLSGQQLADRLGWSQSKVSKIENGRTRPSVEDVAAWTSATGAGREQADELASLAETVATQVHSWRARGHGSLAQRHGTIAEAERATPTLRVFQPAVVPGLLQTADYARHVMALLEATDDEVAAAVTARMERQSVLYQDKQFRFVLTEGALRWRPGPASMMLAQYDRLLNLATLPNVSIGVLPFDVPAPALYTNGFQLFGGDDPFVLVETMTTELHLREEQDLEHYAVVFEQLSAAARSGDDAVSVIGECRNRLL